MILQIVLSGLTAGAIYALVALGFAIIYNASHVINFAQGEFVMIGGMAAVAFVDAGLPLPLAVIFAVTGAALVGLLLEKLAVEPARGAPVVTLIIITIGASIFLRGLAQLVWGKNFHRLPSFSGDDPVLLLGAAIQKQSFWVLGVAALVVFLLHRFFSRSLLGKSVLATAYNPLAARLVGINVRGVLLFSFGLSAALGGLAGILTAPITLTWYDVGIGLGLKGFAAAILGGLGSFPGAIAGGLTLGVLESAGAGYLSSAYKDATAFVILLAVLLLRPDGILGARRSERV